MERYNGIWHLMFQEPCVKIKNPLSGLNVFKKDAQKKRRCTDAGGQMARSKSARQRGLRTAGQHSMQDEGLRT